MKVPFFIFIYLLVLVKSTVSAESVFQGLFRPGPINGITDVEGVAVAHMTKISGEGELHPGIGPIRTGATAILPSRDIWEKRFSSATYTLNGNGELTGTHLIEESGFLNVPVILTDTLDVGRAYDGVVSWILEHYPQSGVSEDVPLPVVGECDDQFLNDIQGRHITADDIQILLNRASSGQFERGNVGAGTGMILFGFKGGIGSASRILKKEQGGYTVGVLVNANNGSQPKRDLIINGVSIGQILEKKSLPAFQNRELKDSLNQQPHKKIPDGSMMIVIATDAPLEARQLRQIAKRAFLGFGRTGLTSNISSGDFAIAFSTTHWITRDNNYSLAALETHDDRMNALFEATAEATQAAIYDALFSARTMVGAGGRTVYGIPVDQVQEMLTNASSFQKDMNAAKENKKE
ncbi:MAG: P1 family peptidase [Chthoniobacterales bacterium]